MGELNWLAGGSIGDLTPIFADILTERRSQEIKWGGRTIANNPALSPTQRLAIVTEEYGECAIELGGLLGNRVARAVNDHGSPENLRKELVQLGACVVGWIEWLDQHPEETR